MITVLFSLGPFAVFSLLTLAAIAAISIEHRVARETLKHWSFFR